MSLQKAARSSDFIASLGVNVHLNATDTTYANVSRIETELGYLGIKNVRDIAPWTQNIGAYKTLGADGIKFDLILSSALSAGMANVDAISQYVSYIEGPNEVNLQPITYKGLTGAAAAVALQKDLYAAVNSDPLLTKVSVLPFSISIGGSYSAYGKLNAYADYGNVHAYTTGGSPPAWWLATEVSGVTDTPGRSNIVTETGYYTMPNHSNGVNLDVQAKWLVDVVLDDFAAGVVKTYIYQLEDAIADPSNTSSELHYGLFNADGSAKTSAIAFHDLTTILADTGASASTFTPGKLDYTLSGLPYYANQTVFAKSNGTFDVALWSETALWNSATNSEYSITPSTVTVTFGQTWASINVYDVLKGTSAVLSASNTNKITLSLGTDPLIIEVKPATTTATAPPATVATAPSNVLNISAGGVFTSSGAQSVTAGSGAATVTASGPASVKGSTGSLVVALTGSGASVQGGSGKLTVTDAKGGNTITGGAGAFAATVSGGNDHITSGTSGSNLIAFVSGDDTVSAIAPTTVMGGYGHLVLTATDDISVMGGGGAMTINASGSSGDEFVFTQPGTANLIKLGNGTNGVTSHGVDTIYAGSGVTKVTTVDKTTVFGGSGALKVTSNVESASVVGGSGAVTAYLNAGGGYAKGGTNGDNILWTASGNTTLVGGGNGDVLTDTSSGSHNMLIAGSGAETLTANTGSADTLVGGSGANLFSFVKGNSAHTELVKSFSTSADQLHFSGFTVAKQAVVSGSLNLTMSDGSVITLASVTSLAAKSIV